MNHAGKFSKTRKIALAGLLMLACGVARSSLASAAPVSIELRDGHNFTGEVDAQTSERQLYLRFESPGIALTRPFAWDEIAGATFGEKRLSAAELKALAATIKAPRTVTRKLELPDAYRAGSTPEAIPTPATPCVSSILVDARIANWNSTVEMDGLLVTVWLLDDAGNVIRAAGSVDVELIAPRSRTFNSAPHNRGHVFDRIGRWVETFPATGRDETYRFRLAFQADHPEFDLTLGRYGLVNVKATIPGCGVFEQSVELVRIRPFSPLRDLNERTTGERFFSIERTSRGDR